MANRRKVERGNGMKGRKVGGVAMNVGAKMGGQGENEEWTGQTIVGKRKGEMEAEKDEKGV